MQASYSGDTLNKTSQSGTRLFIAPQGVPSVVLTTSTSSTTLGVPVTFTATVTGGGLQPTGTITFSDGSTKLGSGTLNANGVTIYTATSLAVGAHNITAGYGGDSNYGTGQSSPATVTIAPVGLAMSIPAPPPVAPGAVATAQITITAGSNYNGTLKLTCVLTSSPGGAQSSPTCTVSPTTLGLTAGASGTVTFSASTKAATAAALSRESLFGLGNGGLIFAVLILGGVGFRRRRLFGALEVLFVIATFGITGCGSGSNGASGAGTGTPATTAGVYTFTVTATDSSSSALTTSSAVSISVQ